jgi:hypothetical protein
MYGYQGFERMAHASLTLSATEFYKKEGKKLK